MYPKLSSAIRSIIKQENFHFDLHDLEDQAIENILKYLKKQRNLGIEERKYLSNLILRTRSFTPIINHNNTGNILSALLPE